MAQARFVGQSLARLGERYRAAKAEAVAHLLSAKRVSSAVTYLASARPDQNIVGIGIGRKRTDGKGTKDHAVRVYVRRKLPASKVGKHRIKSQYDGVPTDVVETGSFRALLTRGLAAAQARTRPLLSGLSVSFASAEQFAAGTIGAIVCRGQDRFILSNNHVLAFENALAIGADIVQPATLDRGGLPQDRIAALNAFTPLAPNGNRIDAAIAQIAEGVPSVAGFVSGQDLVSGEPLSVSTEMLVNKVGRGTGVTSGRIDDVSLDVAVDFASGQFLFEDQILIRASDDAFATDGDSGSLLVASRERRPVGLLFAGSSSHALATPIDRVLSEFDVSILV